MAVGWSYCRAVPVGGAGRGWPPYAVTRDGRLAGETAAGGVTEFTVAGVRYGLLRRRVGYRGVSYAAAGVSYPLEEHWAGSANTGQLNVGRTAYRIVWPSREKLDLLDPAGRYVGCILAHPVAGRWQLEAWYPPWWPDEAVVFTCACVVNAIAADLAYAAGAAALVVGASGLAAGSGSVAIS